LSPRERAVFFGLSLTILLAIGRLTTGGYVFITEHFWFTSGLLLLVLLAVVDQPHFSKDANVFVNGVTGLAALLAVTADGRDWLWWAFFVWSWGLVLGSYALILTRSARLKFEPPVVRAAARIVRYIGRPQAIFSAFFLWGVFRQFTPQSASYKALLLYWSVFMILNLPGVAAALADLWTPAVAPESPPAHIRGQLAPRLIELELTESAPEQALGRMVSFLDGDQELYRGTVVDDRSVAGLRVASVVLGGAFPSGAAVRLAPTIRFVPAEHTVPDGEVPIGIVCAGTTTVELHVNVNPDRSLSEGRLLGVRLRTGDSAYYQIVGARIGEEAMERGRGFHQVGVRAAQLGTWVEATAQFQPVQWVPPPGEAVSSIAPDGPLFPVPQPRYCVGRVPHSPFPVHVDLQDIVTHNSAILGVTGSGKSFLSFHLTRGLVGAGVKVLILDASRQHFVHLAGCNPVHLASVRDLATWLPSRDLVAVHQFAPAVNYPQTTSEFAQAVFEHLQGTITLQRGQNEPARLAIILEEAHSLVPEWNQVAQRGDEQFVNRTARVLLQGRKYGLGCILISQRTANVTKTMLNQCNTIFALQSFDQTGLDFLQNYMGAEYAQALSVLPARHAVMVGKASCSPRPLIVQFDTFT
jgi:hypothetical protein